MLLWLTSSAELYKSQWRDRLGGNLLIFFILLLLFIDLFIFIIILLRGPGVEFKNRKES
jgi:hypothetical protein